MQSDIQINNDIAITILSFDTVYHRDDSTGELKERDIITYQPRGDNKTIITREVARMSRVLPLEECGDNITYLAARRLWDRIQPAYQHWKKNNELPETGVPLAAWAGVTSAQAQVLKNGGLRSVEDVAEASDIVLSKTGLSNALMLRDQAQRFLAGEEKSKSATSMAKLEAENKELREQMAEMMALIREMTSGEASEGQKRRGRPRREVADHVETAETAA